MPKASGRGGVSAHLDPSRGLSPGCDPVAVYCSPQTASGLWLSLQSAVNAFFFLIRDLQPVSWTCSTIVWRVFGPNSSLSGVSAHPTRAPCRQPRSLVLQPVRGRYHAFSSVDSRKKAFFEHCLSVCSGGHLFLPLGHRGSWWRLV